MSEHVCGQRGYSPGYPHFDPICPACAAASVPPSAEAAPTRDALLRQFDTLVRDADRPWFMNSVASFRKALASTLRAPTREPPRTDNRPLIESYVVEGVEEAPLAGNAETPTDAQDAFLAERQMSAERFAADENVPAEDREELRIEARTIAAIRELLAFRRGPATPTDEELIDECAEKLFANGVRGGVTRNSHAWHLTREVLAYAALRRSGSAAGSVSRDTARVFRSADEVMREYFPREAARRASIAACDCECHKPRECIQCQHVHDAAMSADAAQSASPTTPHREET